MREAGSWRPFPLPQVIFAERGRAGDFLAPPDVALAAHAETLLHTVVSWQPLAKRFDNEAQLDPVFHGLHVEAPVLLAPVCILLDRLLVDEDTRIVCVLLLQLDRLFRIESGLLSVQRHIAVDHGRMLKEPVANVVSSVLAISYGRETLSDFDHLNLNWGFLGKGRAENRAPN